MKNGFNDFNVTYFGVNGQNTEILTFLKIIILPLFSYVCWSKIINSLYSIENESIISLIWFRNNDFKKFVTK
jgi:hypothetical protein